MKRKTGRGVPRPAGGALKKRAEVMGVVEVARGELPHARMAELGREHLERFDHGALHHDVRRRGRPFGLDLRADLLHGRLEKLDLLDRRLPEDDGLDARLHGGLHGGSAPSTARSSSRWSSRRVDRSPSGCAHRRATRVRAALAATHKPYAVAAYDATARTLDAYTTAWSAMHEDACEATRLRAEASPQVLDLRMNCLDRRRKELFALTGLFARADAKIVENAVTAASSLTTLAGCADIEHLTARAPLPTDPNGSFQ